MLSATELPVRSNRVHTSGLEVDQAKRMKELERENVRLKRLVADLSLEKQILKDVAAGNL